MVYVRGMRNLTFQRDNHVVVEDSQGIMDYKYKSKIVDPVAFGVGDTFEEAVLSICSSLRRAADEIERNLKNH